MIACERRYVIGRCRNNDYARTHTYVYDDAGDLWPMCEYGWNRSDGGGFSIFRSPGVWSDCALCNKAVSKNAEPCKEPRGHKTKWI